MAIINVYTQSESGYDHEVVDYDGPAWLYIVDNANGNNFQVYEGELCRSNEISRNEKRMQSVGDCTVFFVPAAGAALITSVIAVVTAAAVVLLTPKPKALDNVNRQQESPNNSLTGRSNKARPNERIVDVCGKIKSIPDVIQGEWARYIDKVEVRTAAYCVGRKQLLIEDLKDGDTSFDASGQSAGIYYPFKSPNNSSPDIQIGDPINEPVVGVFESSDAIDQTLKAPNEVSIDLNDNYTLRRPTVSGEVVGEINDFVDSYFGPFGEGDQVNLVDIYVDNGTPGTPDYKQIGANTHDIIQSSGDRLFFDITGDPSWFDLTVANQPIVTDVFNPKMEALDTNITVGPFDISSIKVDRLIVNIYAPNGLFKDGGKGKQSVTVNYRVYYQKLSDNLDPVGPLTPVDATLSGSTSDQIGSTVDIDLGALTFVRWSVERTSDLDFDFNGSVVEEIKIKSVFGLYDIDRTDFGDITMIQTQRRAIERTVLVKDPEVNCIATELVNKYEGGSFSPTLTPNTQAMQSLIRVALDPRIGRRQESEIDLDLLVSVQQEIEDYFQSSEAGEFNYSFDSTNTTAEETFRSITNAAFCIAWREGRVLKAWFEKPQTLPDMVFTHRSKIPGAETWTREFSNDEQKDSVEFVYIDADLYTQETIYIPSDRSGTNPLKVEIPGIKGFSQATWRANREFNKLKYSKINVDFTSTSEGRFVKPSRLISVVKGTRIGAYDGYVKSQNGLELTLSQEVVFTAGDDHSIILKKRDGSVESIPVFDIGQKRKVQLGFLPAEPIYTGSSELKTEFSFASEQRAQGQLILPQEINPQDKSSVQITGINYSDMYYSGDPVQAIKGDFNNDFSDDFSNQE